MSDDAFKTLMQESGVQQLNKEPRIRPIKRPSRAAIAEARNRAEDADVLPARHGLSTEDPPPANPLKPLHYIAYDADRHIAGLLDEVPFPAQLEIDLHGHTVEQAAIAVAQVFQLLREKRLTHLRIVHGVGRHSADGRAVLKGLVNRWLKNNPDIVAFSSARRSDGGTGVVNILTRGLMDDRWART